LSQAPILPPASPRARPSAVMPSEEPDFERPQADSTARKPASERSQRFEPRLDWPR
jgi:hypothetical protein